MEPWSHLMRSVHFASPFSFFAAVATLLILAALAGYVRERRAKNEGAVKFADIESIRDFGKARERIARYARSIFILILVVSAAFLWLRPMVEVDGAGSGANTSDRDTRYLFVVQDISRSVTFKSPDNDGKSVFEVQKEASAEFVKNIPSDFRVAWYFFSKGNIPYRQPTSRMDSLARSISHHNLIMNPETKEEELSQLREFSGGTPIRQALLYTEEMIMELGLEDDLDSLAIVLVTDLKYSASDLGTVLQELSERGIRVYTMTHMNENRLKEIARPFVNNDLIRFYNTATRKNLEAAYADILDLEIKRVVTEDNSPTYESMAPDIAFWMLVFIFAGILLLEQFAHKTKGGESNVEKDSMA